MTGVDTPSSLEPRATTVDARRGAFLFIVLSMLPLLTQLLHLVMCKKEDRAPFACSRSEVMDTSAGVLTEKAFVYSARVRRRALVVAFISSFGFPGLLQMDRNELEETTLQQEGGKAVLGLL